MTATLGQRTMRGRQAPASSTSPRASAITAAMADDASVPSRPLARKAQVVGQAKNSQNRASSWPAE